MLQKVHAQGVSAEIPNPATGPVWVRWLSANGFDRFAGNGPTPASPNPDQIADDQSKLTYSFTVGDVHFVLLNTDTLTTTGNIGWIAYNWIEKDIEKAQQDPRIRTISCWGTSRSSPRPSRSPWMRPSSIRSRFSSIRC
jgi:hypothetical protein